MSREVAVVPHSHWDREWYAPLESYRIRLVEMMDGLIDLMERVPAFCGFHLDGQVALVDDYLDARPEQEPRLRALVRAGRLAVGPWYVLMDEFCVSAETIVRNLQLGLRRSEDLGGPDPLVGYLPDMFGHVAQMPQLLLSAGLGHAVVWRGVPAAVDRTGFWWLAPDGSRVRAEYLPVGYANGAFLPPEPGALVRRVAAHEAEIARFLGPGWPLLLMNGGDHHGPQPAVPALLEAANAGQTAYVFEHTDLAGYLEKAPTDGLPTWTGELRSGARAPVLMGVLSNRVDIKQAAAATELALERTAEPLAALWLPPDLWPTDLLEGAWLEVVRNSAHDSICGCSADAVGRAVLRRYDAAGAVAAEVIDRSAALAAIATRSPGHVVLNPSARTRSGLAEVEIGGAEAPPGTQQLRATAGGTEERRGTGRDLAGLLAGLTADGWLGPGAAAEHASLAATPAGLELTIDRDPTRRADPELAAVMAEAWAQAGARPDGTLTVRVRRAATQAVLARAADVPGWGWAVWRPGTGEPAPTPVAVSPAGLDNELVSVQVDPDSGTFALDGAPGQNAIVDEADAGDTYNFSPLPGAAPVTDPVRVAVEVVEPGPLRGVLRVRRTYQWSVDADAEVVSDLELRAGERAVRITTAFDNRGRDHRVRAHFRLPEPADHSTAECAFATVSRPLTAEGGRFEFPLATFPARRFVTAGELTVTHQGLLEYELAADGRDLALTLLRATGILARPAPAYRPNLAGPPTALRDTQLPGPQIFRYALARACPDPWALADDLWTPWVTARSTGTGHLPEKGCRLRLEGAQVSALYRRGGALEVRLFNPDDRPTTVRVPGHAGWLVDLRGRPEQRWRDGFELGPWALATARLDRASLD